MSSRTTKILDTYTNKRHSLLLATVRRPLTSLADTDGKQSQFAVDRQAPRRMPWFSLNLVFSPREGCLLLY